MARGPSPPPRMNRPGVAVADVGPPPQPLQMLRPVRFPALTSREDPKFFQVFTTFERDATYDSSRAAIGPEQRPVRSDVIAVHSTRPPRVGQDWLLWLILPFFFGGSLTVHRDSPPILPTPAKSPVPSLDKVIATR